ncbi:DUF5682 family protein [Microbulbifer sp. OS29]|uniref:DUF5682 family protein n=1 Tax=Microbulbifer okhotskensis TaxID=2926617 RepID=A0A9X2EQK6_9GAMM|nr:DUF5682 family protein [Microbulbifer okhotskensis]MCO1336634.1 DUF5682 family protein [Microbulbifer okhotskensis]
MSKVDIHYFGIRHHGPGSARRLVAALDQLRPNKVLIEGPADCSDLLPLLASSQMKPPVALLAYAAELPGCSLYYPFVEFSPEYQACLWAVKHGVEVKFIDLPVNIQLAQLVQSRVEAEQAENSDDPVADEVEQEASADTSDPIGLLAKLAGYEDGEAWWNDLIEQNCDNSTEIFATVELAMTALRSEITETVPLSQNDLQREAYMRLEIAREKKEVQGQIAVICGAWHVPAFREKHTAKDDRTLTKSLPAKLSKSKLKATWIPWTSPRLAMVSGYGAGVAAPMWYQHIWREGTGEQWLELWFGQLARELRQSGQVVSTASVIEAVRLSRSLAAVRNRPVPGFEEIIEATVSCLCFGERLIWQQIEKTLLLGEQVGSIPADGPLVPLLEDLQRWQKKTKLKPTALDKEISLDLRSDIGLNKSTLLHRLAVLEVPWGESSASGKSRGTFRENWVLSWQPEYAVKLVENLVYGSTIEQAANNKLIESIAAEGNLRKLAEAVLLALESQLHRASEAGLQQLSERAALASDGVELLDSLPSLVQVQRYGTAREIPLEQVAGLVQRLALQAALALPYACRNLNDEESLRLRNSIHSAHQALQLAESEEEVMEGWWQAFEQLVHSQVSSLQVSGLCTRLLYQAGRIDGHKLQQLLEKALSPAVPAADAARFFEGFFAEAVERLLYDPVLIAAVQRWLLHLDEEAFIEYLPLFRRVFSDLDAMERRRMMELVLGARTNNVVSSTVNSAVLPQWSEQLLRIGKLIHKDKTWAQ